MRTVSNSNVRRQRTARHRAVPGRSLLACVAMVLVLLPAIGAAQDRFLGREDIVLLGLGLRVEPDHQVVPRDIATIVSTFLSAPTPESSFTTRRPRGPRIPVQKQVLNVVFALVRCGRWTWTPTTPPR